MGKIPCNRKLSNKKRDSNIKEGKMERKNVEKRLREIKSSRNLNKDEWNEERMAKNGGEYVEVEKKEKPEEYNKKTRQVKEKEKKRKVMWRKKKRKEGIENERIAVLKEGRRIRRSKKELPLNSTVQWKRKGRTKKGKRGKK